MSNLTDLVPPLELCKLIPDGEFEDSCFARPDIPGEPVHTRNGKVYEHLKRCGITYYPAPTLQEILDSCKDIAGVLNPTVWWQGTWKADCAINKSDKLFEECLEDADFNDLDIAEAQDNNAAAAALKLWLKLKGIEDGE